MAKTSRKRKSEDALPHGKSKHRKTASKDVESDESQPSSEPSEEPFIKNDKKIRSRKSEPVKRVSRTVHVEEEEPGTNTQKHSKKVKSRKSEPVKQSSRVDEYDEDEGRLESQQFLALVEFEAKQKKQAGKAASAYLDGFKHVVKGNEQMLTKHLNSLHADSILRDEEFLEAFTEAFKASRPSAQLAKDTKSKTPAKPVFVSLYEKSRQISAKAMEVIQKFEETNQQTLKIAEESWIDKKGWEAELDNCADILRSGHEVGIQKYQSFLTGTKLVSDEQQDAFAQIMFPSPEGSPTVGWGKLAKRTTKVFKKLGKTINLKGDSE